MQLPNLPSWDVTPAQAFAIQNDLATRVRERDEVGEVRLIAGVDVGFEGEGNRIARAAIVILRASDLVPIDYAIARMPVTFPYVPGLLAFRELPVIFSALQELKTTPDIFIVDGQGRAHPRRLGIASHLGVLLDQPTIGCAKSILCGQAKMPKAERGAWSSLMDGGEQIGVALRTRASASPVYVSVGHRISLSRAIEIVLQSCKSYRLPETTRWAHRVAGGENNVVQTQASLL